MREKEEDGHSLQQPNSLLDCVVRERTLKVDDQTQVALRPAQKTEQKRHLSNSITGPYPSSRRNRGGNSTVTVIQSAVRAQKQQDVPARPRCRHPLHPDQGAQREQLAGKVHLLLRKRKVPRGHHQKLAVASRTVSTAGEIWVFLEQMLYPYHIFSMLFAQVDCSDFLMN
jgi:hypothetical protein